MVKRATSLKGQERLVRDRTALAVPERGDARSRSATTKPAKPSLTTRTTANQKVGVVSPDTGVDNWTMDNLRIDDITGQHVVHLGAPRGWESPEPPLQRNNRNLLSDPVPLDGTAATLPMSPVSTAPETLAGRTCRGPPVGGEEAQMSWISCRNSSTSSKLR